MIDGECGLWPWVSITISVGVRPYLMVPSAKLGYLRA